MIRSGNTKTVMFTAMNVFFALTFFLTRVVMLVYVLCSSVKRVWEYHFTFVSIVHRTTFSRLHVLTKHTLRIQAHDSAMCHGLRTNHGEITTHTTNFNSRYSPMCMYAEFILVHFLFDKSLLEKRGNKEGEVIVVCVFVWGVFYVRVRVGISFLLNLKHKTYSKDEQTNTKTRTSYQQHEIYN